ncbi:MAG: hypothetical protein ACREEW_14615, partial [Caulobacteraceae bacterium]
LVAVIGGLMAAGASPNPFAGNRELAEVWLLGLLIFLIVEIGLALVAAIQWTRFVATEREPSWRDFPGKALWGWFWRWIILGVIFRATDGIEAWLKSQMAGAATWQAQGVDGLIVFAALVLASPFALGLPTVALGLTGRGAESRIRAIRVAGRKYYLGAAIILAPSFLLIWLLNLVPVRSAPWGLLAVVGISEVFVLVATVLISLTYVTQVYLKGQAIEGAMG